MPRTVLSVLLVVAAGAARADDPPDYKAIKGKWEADARAERAKRVDIARAQVAEYEARVAAFKKKLPRATPLEAARLRASIAAAAGAAEKAEKAVAEAERWEPRAGPADLKAGFFGKLGDDAGRPAAFTVRQVLDKKTALMGWGEKTYWVELDAAKLADGDGVTVARFVHCPGTKQYTAATGAVRTVLRLVLVD
jgi:hypothetical protein